MEALAFDVRLALRGLRRDWTYALVSVATLALALTLNATVFTVMNAMLFRGFPQVRQSDQLVFLQEHDRLGQCCLSYADVGDWQAQAHSFQGMAIVGGRSAAFRDGQGRPMDLRLTTVGANVFGLLGVPPALGRDFTAADALPGARPVVMLSNRVWQARFGGRADVVGSIVQVDGAPAEIAGVMPVGFEFPMAATGGLWMPVVPGPDLLRRGLTPGGFTAIARLNDGVTLAEARAELEAINRGLEAAYPETNRGLVPSAVDHAQFTSGADARIIWGSLWGAACLVLLIACANVANLTVVRTVGRGHEFATCLALGAGRPRMIRQMLLEGAIVAGLATVPAWYLTRWSVAQWAALAESLYQAVDYSVTTGTLAYLAAASAASGALLSIAPVVRVLHLSVRGTLKGDGRGVTHGRRTRQLLTALVSGQMALALVLLAGAGVLVRSFANIVGAETGVRSPESVLVGRLRLPSATYPTPQSRLAFFDRVQERLRTVAGVERTSVSGGLPVKFSGGLRQLEVEGDAPAIACRSRRGVRDHDGTRLLRCARCEPDRGAGLHCRRPGHDAPGGDRQRALRGPALARPVAARQAPPDGGSRRPPPVADRGGRGLQHHGRRPAPTAVQAAGLPAHAAGATGPGRVLPGPHVQRGKSPLRRGPSGAPGTGCRRRPGVLRHAPRHVRLRPRLHGRGAQRVGQVLQGGPDLRRRRPAAGRNGAGGRHRTLGVAADQGDRRPRGHRRRATRHPEDGAWRGPAAGGSLASPAAWLPRWPSTASSRRSWWACLHPTRW